MADYILSCCSTADMTKERFEALDIHYVCFHYQIDGKDYMDDLGQTMSFDKFYEAMANGAMTKTSQVNVDEYIAYFTPFLKQGKDILHLTLSSGISGTINSALQAAETLRKEFPDRKLIVMDSLCASGGYALLMEKLAELKKGGMGIDELAAWAEEHKLEVRTWFFTSNLTYLIRGGRVSKTSGMLGQLLGICPIMEVNVEGKLPVREKIRTKRKTMKRIVEKMVELGKDHENYSETVIINDSACREDSNEVAALVKETFPKHGAIAQYDVGTTIGSHTGPGVIVLSFWGDKRVN